MKARRCGYVVICGGAVMRLHVARRGLPDGGVLVIGTYATLFSTRARARKAVARTVNYAIAEELSWPILDQAKVEIRLARIETTGRGDVHSRR